MMTIIFVRQDEARENSTSVSLFRPVCLTHLYLSPADGTVFLCQTVGWYRCTVCHRFTVHSLFLLQVNHDNTFRY